MGIRHLARQRALQLLYALELAAPGESFEEIERSFLATERLHRRGWGPFGRSLARETHSHGAELDAAIGPLLKHWTLERLPILERLCLRLALAELKFFPDIPLRVTINEYIELARMYGTDDSTLYINAVLDRLAQEYPHKDVQVSKEPQEEAGPPPSQPPSGEPADADPPHQPETACIRHPVKAPEDPLRWPKTPPSPSG